ncbi:protein involved in polysaccharide export with SLBB domain [Roseiarcus fermentans]|uniref:Protein involved in polysaccharide export with SLBB domain n=1 Tax=Roseiarcus fermentans TaxID=1473586 RepID=A0A366FQU2_9HYPH|nr:SLBB domain-containing protein [Roseiarcus fermentans]RBP16095.1 protein involved in polysaccharide export with SLBB domain [Roseiarcus fermentans]
MKIVATLLALALFLALAVVRAGAQPSDGALRIGDVLTIGLPGEAALNKDFPVDRKGAITLPEAGALRVAGHSLDAATVMIRDALAHAYRDLDKLSVTLKERRLPLTVLGYVKNPGDVVLAGDANVQTALVAAGGVSQGAQLDRMTVTHADGKREQFDYKKYLDTGDANALPRLAPLDVIFVPASPLTGNVQIDFDGRTLAATGDGGEERSAIRIFGEVNTPATFAYRKGASVIDMIMRAGGVTRYSAPEQIRILNKTKPVIFNLQAYLDTGDTALLPDVEPGATIYVPKSVEEIRSGKLTVYVMGEVAKPGAFETRDGASFIDILANAGGPTRYADTRQIHIIHGDGKITNVDLVKYADGSGGQLPSVKPGDAIFVPEKNESADQPSWLKIAPTRAVQVLGALYKPGRYEWSDEMSLFDLLSNAGGPTAHADISHIQILRKDGDKAAPVLFDLDTFLKGGGSLQNVPKIHAGYVVMVPELPQDTADNKAQWMRQGPERSIYVMGQVGIPGRYAFNTGLGFLDILTAANGPTAGADVRNIRVAHRGEKGSRVSRVNLSAYFATGDEKLLPKVRPGDVIFVPDQSKNYLDEPPSEVVRVLGAVGKPGRYPYSDEMSILDLLAEAGGPTADALQDRIIVVNLSSTQSQAHVFDLLAFAKTGDIRRVPVVRAGDVVYIPNHGQDEWQQITGAIGNMVSAASLAGIAASLSHSSGH